jgi:Flp pilus assembly pilin Flp
MFKRFWVDQRGADATEYALLAAIIAVTVIGGAQSLGLSVGGFLTSLAGMVGDIPLLPPPVV